MPLSFTILAFLGVCAPAQDPPFLAHDKAAMKWDAAKNGPLLVVEPERVWAVQEGTGLPAFARKRVTIRGLTAIVPTHMTVVSEKPPEPNLIEGLPRDVKVLYLMTKLTPAQWKTITSRGLGREDLQGEARAVFESIIPATFAWQRYHVAQNGRNSIRFGDEEKGVLTEKERDQVRLQLIQSLNFRISTKGTPTAQTILDPQRGGYGRPGDVTYARDDTPEQERSELFGASLRQKVENRLKPSHLAYRDRAFDATVSVPPSATVGEILRLVRSATGVEIIADLRVNDRQVVFMGTQTRAGDLLEALALALTGTYRRVADAYVLTSDLDGMGARRLRLALWADDLIRRTEEWKRKLYQTLSTQDVRSKVSFDAKDPFAPNAALRDRLNQKDERLSASDPIPVAELTSDLQEFVKRFAGTGLRDRDPYDTSQVRVGAKVDFRFILPNGTALKSEGQSLGDTMLFAPDRVTPVPASQVVSQRLVPVETRHRLIVRVNSAEEARKAAAEAKARGFGEVWLETTSAEALRAGTEAGLPVRLVIRPWYATDSPNPSDVTLLGDTGPQLVKRGAQSSQWTELVGSYPEFRSAGRPVLIPGSAAQRNAWASYERLAQTPGLAGTVLLESRLNGYGYGRSSRPASLSRELIEMTSFGYSPEIRVRYLRERGIDPIDIAPNLPALDADLRQPFFLDNAQAGRNIGAYLYDAPHPKMNSARIEWDRYRMGLPAGALKELQTRLSAATPLLVEDPAMDSALTSNARTLVNLPDPATPATRWVVLPGPDQRELSLLNQRGFTRPGDLPTCFDATAIPIKALTETLTRWRIGATVAPPSQEASSPFVRLPSRRLTH